MSRTHHALDYVEITVTDMAAAQTFYRDAFGWGFTDYGPDYAGITDPSRGDEEVGGLAVGTDVATAGVLVLLYSDDLDATVAAVQRAGGAIHTPPYEFPGGRRFYFTDPSGNRLGVWQSAGQ